MQILVYCTSAVDIAVGRITSPSSISVDPLKPVLGTMTGHQILEIICSWNALRFGGPQEVLLDWVSIVAKGNLNGALESVNIAIVARSLVCLMLFHKRYELLCSPALGLEIVVIGCGGTCIHLECVRFGTSNCGTCVP